VAPDRVCDPVRAKRIDAAKQRAVDERAQYRPAELRRVRVGGPRRGICGLVSKVVVGIYFAIARAAWGFG
jgi:hypothetical protein